MSDFDPNKIAVDFLQQNLSATVALASTKQTIATNIVRTKLAGTYRHYIDRLLIRYANAKSFFIRTEPTPLYDFFVPLNLATQRRNLIKPSAADLAAISPCSIVIGTGGSGKSMLMKHFLVSTLRDRTKTPIFLELRHLNQGTDTLREALLNSVQANGLAVDDDYMERALRAGHFLILLDGYDELERKTRTRVAQAIQDLGERFPQNWIILSSRPDAELDGWNGFTQFEVLPLMLAGAVELVNKLPFDDPIKSKFVKDLKNDLFDRHESFLSNPLLLSIMLLTYSDIAHIPNKLSIFYNQAYESLFQKHDALKGGFQRERRTDLDIQDFAKVFAAFSIQTYDRRLFTFSKTLALDVLGRGRAISQVGYDSEAFLDDCLQAVCLLVEEGMDVTFAHRSFQEYFVARFIASSPPHLKKQLIVRVARNFSSDDVISLLYELDPFSVEEHYVLPALGRMREAIGVKRKIGKTHFLRFTRLLYSHLEVEPEEPAWVQATIRESSEYHALAFAYRLNAKLTGVANPRRTAADAEKERDVFVAEFGISNAIPTERITSSSEYFGFLDGVAGWRGRGQLEALIGLEKLIRGRHREAESSIEEILTAHQRHRRVSARHD